MSAAATPPPRPEPAAPALRLENLVKEFQLGTQRVRAVDGVSLEVAAGTCVALLGRSGSGKSTLLHLIAGIDVPDSGDIWIDDVRLAGLDDDALTLLRRDRLGMVHQFFNLLPTLSVRENVALPALLARQSERDAHARADALLADVGLTERASARPHTLSGGEMQRAAIARALIRQPRLLLADEPTGNLDSRTAGLVLELMRGLASRHGATVLIVTHSREAAAIADRRLEMHDGRIVEDRGR